MNARYGIINMQILIKSKEQLNREKFPWGKSFRNLRINEMVYLFNKTIKNILSNYIPHERVTCDDRDPPWINNKIKQLILEIIVHTEFIF